MEDARAIEGGGADVCRIFRGDGDPLALCLCPGGKVKIVFHIELPDGRIIGTCHFRSPVQRFFDGDFHVALTARKKHEPGEHILHDDLIFFAGDRHFKGGLDYAGSGDVHLKTTVFTGDGFVCFSLHGDGDFFSGRGRAGDPGGLGSTEHKVVLKEEVRFDIRRQRESCGKQQCSQHFFHEFFLFLNLLLSVLKYTYKKMTLFLTDRGQNCRIFAGFPAAGSADRLRSARYSPPGSGVQHPFPRRDRGDGLRSVRR